MYIWRGRRFLSGKTKVVLGNYEASSAVAHVHTYIHLAAVFLIILILDPSTMVICYITHTHTYIKISCLKYNNIMFYRRCRSTVPATRMPTRWYSNRLRLWSTTPVGRERAQQLRSGDKDCRSQR